MFGLLLYHILLLYWLLLLLRWRHVLLLIWWISLIGVVAATHLLLADCIRLKHGLLLWVHWRQGRLREWIRIIHYALVDFVLGHGCSNRMLDHFGCVGGVEPDMTDVHVLGRGVG